MHGGRPLQATTVAQSASEATACIRSRSLPLRQIARRISLNLAFGEALRLTTFIAAQRCPTINRPLAASSKQHLVRFTLALQWRASSCQRSRLLKLQRPPVFVEQ